ncbi:MAG: isocitrate lyase/PEP mutase family protein [Sphaerochaetaceae bacterium]|nr:isocitrate lyase/PEP mutase family protein [Sphaerochaetaceae bacterium]
MDKKVTFRQLLNQKQLFAPCVYDCFTARAAELSGYDALMLSGGAIAYSQDGLPDMAFASIDEVCWAIERITSMSPLPLIADADDGYGESPVVVYRNMYRVAKAGAMGLTLDDSTGIRGFERMHATKPRGHETVPKEVWLAKIKAALAACEGTDCVVIARIHVRMNTPEGFREAIDRALRAKDLGAEMIMLGTHNMEMGLKVAQNVPGWKMWPDIFSVNGVPNCNLEEIDKLGYRFVTMHLFEKAIMYGMMKYGTNNRKAGNPIYSAMDDMNGIKDLASQMQLINNYEKWLQFEQDCRNL